jgi:allantoicase
VRLGAAGKISRVEVDTLHFKGNFPESCSLEVCRGPRELTDPQALDALPWEEILPRTKLRANSLHVFTKELTEAGEATHARFHIYPDGGVARLRIFGTLASRSS